MSYSRRVHGEAHYSRTVSISYPASESGGSRSATVSGSVPVDITVYVDTNPFDNSVANCNGQISGLTGSVVAMNAAQCAAIKQTGNDVSAHVTNGFFSMIKSDISDNMAALFSKINSQIGLVMEKTNQVKKQQQVMEDDYQRTKARYVKVFNDLDDECRKRVLELDKKAFALSEQVQHEQLSEQESRNAAFVLTGMNDNSIVNQQLSTACLRSKVGVVIHSLATNVSQQLTYANEVNSILYEQKCAAIETPCIPVLFAEADDISESGAKMTNCCVSTVLGEATRNQVAGVVEDYFATKNDGWTAPEKADEEQVNASFNTYAEKMLTEQEQSGSTAGKREYAMIMRLRNN